MTHPTAADRPKCRARVGRITVTALALAAGACAGGTKTTSGAAAPAAGVTAAAASVTITTLDGWKIAVPGGKPTAMFFFSVGCGECGPGARSLALAQCADTGGKTRVAPAMISEVPTAAAMIRSAGSRAVTFQWTRMVTKAETMP